MQRRVRSALFGLVLASSGVLVATDVRASDAKGPACADFAGAASLVYSATVVPGQATAEIAFDLAAPSCSDWSYTLHVLDAAGERELSRSTAAGDGSSRFRLTAVVPGDPVLPPSAICVFTTTTSGSRLADVAPDTGCAPLQIVPTGHGDYTWN